MVLFKNGGLNNFTDCKKILLTRTVALVFVTRLTFLSNPCTDFNLRIKFSFSLLLTLSCETSFYEYTIVIYNHIILQLNNYFFDLINLKLNTKYSSNDFPVFCLYITSSARDKSASLPTSDKYFGVSGNVSNHKPIKIDGREHTAIKRFHERKKKFSVTNANSRGIIAQPVTK